MLPAPGRFSTITGTCHLLLSRSARARATGSTGPPASNGTPILTVRSGYSAHAGRGRASAIIAASHSNAHRAAFFGISVPRSFAPQTSILYGAPEARYVCRRKRDRNAAHGTHVARRGYR